MGKRIALETVFRPKRAIARPLEAETPPKATKPPKKAKRLSKDPAEALAAIRASRAAAMRKWRAKKAAAQ